MTRPLARLAATSAALAVVVAALAVLSGWVHVVATHGTSMRPLYTQGDLIVAVKAPAYEVGDIVAYHGGTPGLVVLHRIIGGTPAGWVIKGDNNESVDPKRPTSAEVLGRAVLHVPRGGLVLDRLISPPALAVEALLLFFAGGTAVGGRRGRRRGRHGRAGTGRRARAPAPARPWAPVPATRGASRSATGPATIRSLPPLASLPPALRSVGLGAAAAGLVGLVLGALAWTTPTATTTTVSTTSTRSMTFSYTADVPASAAYDGTRVQSPQPVFRRLAHVVDVRYRYRGAPGTLSVTARLSTESGWTTTEQLAAPVAFSTPRHDGVVSLDLDALQARADAAAAAIGVPASTVAVTVTPRVVPVSGPVFTPGLSLVLSPTQLSLANGPGGLAATASPARPHAVRQSASLHLAMLTVPVALARAVSVLLVVAGAVGALVLLVLAGRIEPLSEGERIRRQHAGHLVQVSPLTTRRGRPTADVPTIEALVALAERYGSAVLHWSRDGVDTFVVLDEGVTYRYRTGAVDPGPPAPGSETPAEQATAEEAWARGATRAGVPDEAPARGERPWILTPRTAEEDHGLRSPLW